MKQLVIELEARSCESCGSHDLEILWRYQRFARTQTSNWLFDVSNVICKRCGFIFVSPSPTPECLAAYYADSYSRFSGQKEDFSTENRLQFIQKCLDSQQSENRTIQNSQTKTITEIGSNQKGAFHQKLGELFETVLAIEPNQSCDSDFNSLDDLSEGLNDFIVHYFVLEHIPKVRAFLNACHRSLKPGGIMVCEVPDLKLYPDDIAALILYEHCNHFSVKSLVEIAQSIGFELIDYSNSLCSRSYGFVVGFRKVEIASSIETTCKLKQYAEAKDYFLRGTSKAQKIQQQMIDIHQKIGLYQPILFWGANDNLLRFLDGGDLPETVTVVDSDPRKKTYFDQFSVFQPDEAQDAIHACKLIVIFTRLHADDILKTLHKTYQKSLDPKLVFIVDFT